MHTVRPADDDVASVAAERTPSVAAPVDDAARSRAPRHRQTVRSADERVRWDRAREDASKHDRTLALIPAHNEELDVAIAIRSVRDQVDQVVVVADNCSDGTAAVAAAEGAVVFKTRDNHAKKAGALNQALTVYLQGLSDDDYVVLMDADSAVCDGWVEKAKARHTRATGGISAAYVPRDVRGFVPLLQKVEYAQERRRIARKQGRVHVLSGVATLFQVKVLREIADKRGEVLSGQRGWFYDETSLTEDFEVTIALKHLGYRPRAPKDCIVETDLMPNWKALYHQRIRWQRGTLETLRTYTSLLALPLILLQLWTYLRSLAWPLVIGLVSVAAYYDILTFRSWWLLIFPIIAVEQIISTRRAGPRACIVAGLLLPVIMYDNFRSIVYWTALWKSVRHHAPTWTT